jgi:hypothetical protein
VNTGNEFLSSNIYRAYPFKDNVLGLCYIATAVYGAAATIPTGCIVDATIAIDPASTVYTQPPAQDEVTPLYLAQIAWATATPTEQSITLTCGSQTLVVEFDMADWNLDLPFQVVQASGTKIVAKLVLHTVNYMQYVNECTEAGPNVVNAYGTRLQLQPTVVNPGSRSVYSLSTPDTSDIVGDVILQAGYNMIFTPSTVDGSTNIRFDVGSGLGLGRKPCEGTPSYIAAPQLSGDVIIKGDPCIEVVTSPSGVVTLYNVCKPCCDCEDYKKVFDKLVALHNLAKDDILARLTTANNDYYTPGVTRFNNSLKFELKLPAWSAGARQGVARYIRRELAACGVEFPYETDTVSEAGRDIGVYVMMHIPMPKGGSDDEIYTDVVWNTLSIACSTVTMKTQGNLTIVRGTLTNFTHGANDTNATASCIIPVGSIASQFTAGDGTVKNVTWSQGAVTNAESDDGILSYPHVFTVTLAYTIRWYRVTGGGAPVLLSTTAKTEVKTVTVTTSGITSTPRPT